MLSHRTCLVSTVCNLKFSNRLTSFTNFSSSNENAPSSIKSKSSIDPSLSAQSSSDDSYQFNEKLIRRIKRNQLFSIEYLNIKHAKDAQEAQLSLPADVQKYLPSVSKIISETMTEQSIKVLEIWKANMIKKLGFSGFQKYQNDLFSKGNYSNVD